MKGKILLFILIISIGILPACDADKNHTENPESPSAGTTFDPANTEIAIEPDDNVFEYTSEKMFFSDVGEHKGYDYLIERENWQKTIEEEFNIELEIFSIYDEYSQGIILQYPVTEVKYGYLRDMIEKKEIKGLLRIAESGLLKKMAEDGLILPLDAYLEGNSNWLEMPLSWREAYKFNGRTWAVPTSFSSKAYSRYYRSDWLNNLNRSEPYAIDDFYEVLKAFTYDDPDGDGLPNTRGMDRFMGAMGLEDIFTAYDARPNYEGDFLPTWNPNKNMWEDSFIKPEFKEAMQFLLSCEQEGVLGKTELIDNRIDFQRGISGSFCSDNPKYEFADLHMTDYIPDAKPGIVYTPGLLKNIDDSICGIYTKYLEPYVMLSNSGHPYSTINTLIDVFTASRRGYLLGKYGPDSIFSEHGNLIGVETKVIEGKTTAFEGPRIMVKSPLHDDYQVYDYKYDDDTGQYLDTSGRQRVKALAADDLCYEIPLFTIDPDYGIDGSQIEELGNLSWNLVGWVLDGMTDLDSAIGQYRQQAKIIGMQRFLNEQNEKLGVTSDQTY